jgi:osmoprotectant transport system substrate-binding protein
MTAARTIARTSYGWIRTLPLEGLIGRSRGVPMRAVAVVMVVGALVAGCTDLDVGPTRRPSTGGSHVIVVGVSGAFAENQIVAEMYAQVLEHAGYTVERLLELRSRESSQNALEAGVIDVKPEYLSSLLLFLDPNAEASADASDVARQTAELLRSQGLTLLTPSAAEDTNQFVANAETAERFDLTTMSSLAAVAGQLTFGGPPECPQRPFCLPGLHEVYGVLFDDFTPLDAGGPLTVDALKADEVQIGLLFSTDPSIGQNGFVPLADDRHLQDAENITPLIRSEKLNVEVRALLDAVSARLSTEKVTELVGKVVIDGQDVAAVANGFLTANGLLQHR